MKPKVILVDDDPLILNALERLFRPTYEVHSFENPELALKALENETSLNISTNLSPSSDFNLSVSVIISDYQLPAMTGLEFLEKAQILQPLATRAIISGNSSINELVQQVEKNLVHRVILKPWENDYLLLQMAEMHQMHLSNARHLQDRQNLEEARRHDPLTGLLNRSAMDEALKKELERAQRHQRVFSILMLDVDEFKKINDQQGHQAGDSTLIQIAKTLQQGLRSLDLVFRYGGDELLVLLPETDSTRSYEVAQRLQQQLQKNFSIATPGSPIAASVSMGLVSYPTHAYTINDLIRKADQAMYVAKRRGRHQIEIASS